MKWYDLLPLISLIGIFGFCIWGSIKELQKKKQGKQPNYKPQHYSGFDKRLENQ